MTEQPKKTGKKILKFIIFIGVICAPIVVLMIVFTPFAKKEIPRRIIKEYKLPADYQQGDVVDIVKKMKRDPEYAFYFFALSKDSVAQGTYEAYEIMNRAREQKKLQDELMQLQKKTSALAMMFYHLEYTDDFSNNPSKYPDLSEIMFKLLFEEFKLAIMGVCYKSTYDETFRFQWSPTARKAARKLHLLMQKIGQK